MNRDLLVVGLVAGLFALLIGGIRIWDRRRARQARCREAAMNAQFDAIATAETRASFTEIVADLHDVFADEDL
ncbi:hypothetical protein ACFYOK_37555 [Microbispora bryophytorum]|uniref:hypothetical protein n=1 Tax=Microbispora bryophytorum TaxID=1460882 RepID=UPI0034018295